MLEVSNLVKHFPVKTWILKAVDGISFKVGDGEILGLVGESGCGKTTLGRGILRLMEPTSGEVLFRGNSVTKMGKEELRKIRRYMQIIFQDPYSSLNPRMNIRQIVGEGLKIHKITSGKELNKKVENMLERVGIPATYINKNPRDLSGGQRQRIAIARAIVLSPAFIVCDEPVSALDVSIQSQILNLLIELKNEFGLSYLFISHDLSVIEYISDRVMVMYLGQIVESAPVDAIYKNPKHPYTLALMNAIPVVDPDLKRKRRILQGDPPSPINPPDGCRFHPRCPEAMEVCKSIYPEQIMISPNHTTRCHLYL